MPKGVPLAKEQIDVLLLLYDQGVPVDKIADRLGISKAAISTAARFHGRKRYRMLSQHMRWEIGERVGTGEITQTQAKEIYGITQSYAGRLARKWHRGELIKSPLTSDETDGRNSANGGSANRPSADTNTADV